MTADFHQKLLNWFCSILLLMTTLAMGLLVVWFLKVPLIEPSPYMDRGAWVAAMMGEAMIAYAVLLPPLIIWHLLDFFERTQRENLGPILKLFANYVVFAGTLLLSQVGMVLSMTGWFDWNSCDDLPHDAFPHSCRVGIDGWTMALIFVPLLFSLVLCIGKALVTIKSRLTKAG